MQDLGETYFYSDSRMSMIASFVGSFLAVGLLIGAIVGLDQLHSKGKRLGLICALTIAFALVLIFTTTSTRGEIFGASAAYVLRLLDCKNILTYVHIQICSSARRICRRNPRFIS